MARAFELSWAHSLIEHRHRSWSPEEIHLFQRLASSIVYGGSPLRAAPTILTANEMGPSGLWRHGISGDRPIVLARLAGGSEVPLARQLIAAHTFLRFKGIEFDLVLVSEEPASYQEGLSQEIKALIRSSDLGELADKPGGIFVLRDAVLPESDRILLQATARVVLVGDRGLLDSQLDRIERTPSLPAPLEVSREIDSWNENEPVPASEQVPTAEGEGEERSLLFDNGFGGFTRDGREYVVTVRSRPTGDTRRNGRPRIRAAMAPALPPAPWSNVIANPRFGTLVTETGGGTTWSGNSQLNRLTAWSNDPVGDPPGEVIYLRDEETGEFWTPTPLPVPSNAPTLIRHGQGYTVFERMAGGLSHELTVFVPVDDPVKVFHLKLRNPGERSRRLSATFYVEWVMGTVRDTTGSHIVTELEPESGFLLARNAFRTDFAANVAFMDMCVRPYTSTGDRNEFLGRLGHLSSPAALRRTGLSGRVGPALDPCGALHAPFELEPGEEINLVFLLGEADSRAESANLVARYNTAELARAALDAVHARWNGLLSAVQVETPEPAFDLLLNRWLPYQIVSGRMWGRTGFYQAGGAYGFRDQLQDVMALVHAAPELAREHILRASGRQFVAGDVQHWWHPPVGSGVRTRIADDLLWLPFVVTHYVNTTGDRTLLDETAPFLEAPELGPGQEDAYGLPSISADSASVYEHCVRAIDRSAATGPHGLPLIGTGDWNDGMNRVGAGGKGESVWLAWFRAVVLERFARLAEQRSETERVVVWRDQAEALRQSIEEHAWDGRWYLRAYFDDGTPLGSASNSECRIDSLSQSWAWLGGANDPQRAELALKSAVEQLVRRDDRLVLLLTPPFDRAPIEPGYIKGYVPGIRENGGQYTHAAAWLVEAVARSGRGGDAFALFDLLNPIQHAATSERTARYKVEPYVTAGDVYSGAPHNGRGGWTWYTGSAGWLYQVGLGTLLGLRRIGDRLELDPRIPSTWPEYSIQYRYRSATYRIVVENPQGLELGTRSLSLDGHRLEDGALPLADDGRNHEVRVVIGPLAKTDQA